MLGVAELGGLSALAKQYLVVLCSIEKGIVGQL